METMTCCCLHITSQTEDVFVPSEEVGIEIIVPSLIKYILMEAVSHFPFTCLKNTAVSFYVPYTRFPPRSCKSVLRHEHQTTKGLAESPWKLL